ncbi:GNAT family N-acetyltransferase [Chitinimonas koreensis]|uniref:GNAT family N-acetyltransferase n=1 Tax=Chitinimonas koreensis TaxID=356302 RepID=UPI000423D385|nr:GNAT family N-acetyltransferase [Chitinimonas koreensis]QNM97448.1 GNAT family N-acetyltransferase [Chitinimonas koreensis]
MPLAPATPHLTDGSLVLRLATPADIPAILAFYGANRAALAPFEPRRPEDFHTEAFWQLRVAMNRSQFAERRSACFFVFEPDERSVIGTCNFTNVVGYPHYAATLGYALAQSQWGRGRMRRALTLGLGWAFEAWNLHRVAANHLPDNQRSARLLARLGFEREGLARDYLLIDGVWRDHVLNALTRADWQADPQSIGLVRGGNGRPSSV